MRKCYQSFKRLLTGQEGSMAPVAVAAAIAMLVLLDQLAAGEIPLRVIFFARPSESAARAFSKLA